MQGQQHDGKAEDFAAEAHKPLAQEDDQDTAAAWAAVAAWAITETDPDRRKIPAPGIVPPGVPGPRLPGVGPLPGPLPRQARPAAGRASRPASRGTNIRVGKDLGDIALNLLADLLGAEVIATGPPRSPLPVTGPCSRCGASTTVYGPGGRPLCDRCRESMRSRPAKTAKDDEPG